MTFPKRLFKYMEKKYLDTAMRDGEFQIGTLFNFRKTEQYGTTIGDVDEGKMSTYLTSVEPIEFDLLSDDPRATHTRQVLKGWDGLPAGSTVTIRMEPNSFFELDEQSADVFIYCATTTYDAEAMKRFGYDACLSIDNPEKFFDELTLSLGSRVTKMVSANVEYGERRIPHDKPDKIHPAFIKPLSSKYQQEFRVVWEPVAGDSPEVLVVRCATAAKYCSEYEGGSSEQQNGGNPMSSKISVSDLTATEMDELVGEIAKQRVSLQPEHANEPPKISVATANPAWVLISLPDVEGTAVLQIRHPGLGWLAFTIPPNEIENMIEAFRKGLAFAKTALDTFGRRK